MIRYADVSMTLQALLRARYSMQVRKVSADAVIPGSYWGPPEAGLIENRLYVRDDTPLHSALHEACHFICMDGARRTDLHRDAGGTYDEENAVCYLQIVLADYLPSVGRGRMMHDMDAWGYTFRLGSARRWFETDAADARRWLLRHELLRDDDRPTWKLRA